MNARSITGLAIALLLGLSAGSALAGDHVFVGVKKCGSCHSKKLLGNQMDVWRKSAHSRAFETLQSDRAAELAKAAGISGSAKKAPECLRCHVTGYGLPAKRFAHKRPVTVDGVGCETCHGAGKDYRKKKIMADTKLATKNGHKTPKAKDCLVCHNSESPTWDPQRYTLANGKHDGFDFEAAMKKIRHKIPPDVKGHYLELTGKKKSGK